MDWTVKIHRAVRQALARLCDWEDRPARVLVAVSGGVDSMVLLHALNQCAAAGGVEVQAVHVNHHLRTTANDDAEFVKRTCKEWQIPLQLCSVDLQQIPPSERRGMEADARVLRHRAIADAARAAGASSVWLAHHADDQLETVMWRLLRGSSMSGLSGMQEWSERAGLFWVRPLLSFEKAALCDYAAKHRVTFVEDETNQDPVHLRNFLRQHIIPQLKERQPNLAGVVGQAAKLWRDEDRYMEQQARLAMHEVCRASEGRFDIRRDDFLRLARPLQRRVIKIILYCFPSYEWTSAHIESVVELIAHGGPSGQIYLTEKLRAWCEYNHVRIGEMPDSGQDGYHLLWQPATHSPLYIPTPSGHWELRCDPVHASEVRRPKDLWGLLTPKLSEVTVRTGKPGDRMTMLGLNGSKKVQDIFVDAKIPRWQRATWPLVEVNGVIVWVVGLARAADYLVASGDYEALLITARRDSMDATL